MTDGTSLPEGVAATSDQQWRATSGDGDSPPPWERVRDGVWAVAVPLPGGQRSLAYTLTYLLRDGEGRVHVVDPGWDTADNRALLRGALDELTPYADVASILITHLHEDHLGLGEWLRDFSGAPLVMHELEVSAASGGAVWPGAADLDVWQVPAARKAELESTLWPSAPGRSIDADVIVRGSLDHLHPAGLDIDVIHTPGHTAGSVCLRLPTQRLLLTGDHVLPALYPGIGLGGKIPGRDPIADTFASLDKLKKFDDHEVLPGHHYRFTGLSQRIAAMERHHRRRSGEVEGVLRDRPQASVYEVASALTWSGGWQRMHGPLLYSALLQTSLHIDHLRPDKPVTDVGLEPYTARSTG